MACMERPGWIDAGKFDLHFFAVAEINLDLFSFRELS